MWLCAPLKCWNRSLKLRWQCVNKCLGLMWTWAVVKRNPESLTHGPFPPNTNSHSALLWVQLKTLIHASTIHKQESIFYLLQHPMRPISGCQSEEAPSRLVASAVIFSSEREAPSGQAPHAVWHSRCHPNERMPWTAHGLETSLREVQFKKYVKVFFAYARCLPRRLKHALSRPRNPYPPLNLWLTGRNPHILHSESPAIKTNQDQHGSGCQSRERRSLSYSAL